jgi:hypothetical protein
VTLVLVAVVAFIAGAVIWRRRPAPPSNVEQLTESYWQGYRRGHDDGQMFRAVIERTPSPN